MSELRRRDPRERDPAYLGWVAKLPCVACMSHGVVNWRVQVAHVRAASLEHGKRYTGKAEKPSDMWTLPLCMPHHTGDKRIVDLTQHDMGELDFWKAHGIDPFGLCLELRAIYDGRAGKLGATHNHGVLAISKVAAAGRRQIQGVPMENEERVRAQYIAGQAGKTIPTKALSIRQPWAWLIVNGYKDIENRSWLKRFPPRILVHAGQSVDLEAHSALLRGFHPAKAKATLPAGAQAAYAAYCVQTDRGLQPRHLGGFVGMVDITGVQGDHDSPWFVGDYGYILANGIPLPFLPWRGVLGFFDARVTP